MRGKPEELAELVRADKLNERERNYIADFLLKNPPEPKKRRGPKRASRNPFRVPLMRFWLREVDGWTKDDAIRQHISTALGISITAVRKYEETFDAPQTEGEKRMALFSRCEIEKRRRWLASDDPEDVALMGEMKRLELG